MPETENKKSRSDAGCCQGADVRPFAYAINLIDGKWKMHILFWLWKRDVMRYGELKRGCAGITHKMLSNKLKELERDGLILRHEYPQVPPKVEYRLSAKGHTLMPILHEICKWGAQNYMKGPDLLPRA